MLEPGQRVRGIFHPTDHGPGPADPCDVIEEWRTLTRALQVFTERAQGAPTRTYYVGQPIGWSDWYGVDGTAFMDVWIETPDRDQPPTPPGDMWQRWRLSGVDVHRENF